MSLITTSHQNPGAVTKRLETLSQIQKNDLTIKVVNAKMDELYDKIYKIMPVKTGYMRDSMSMQSSADVSQIVVTAYYSRFVEHGTRGRTARNFFFPNVIQMSIEIIIAVRELYMTVR